MARRDVARAAMKEVLVKTKTIAMIIAAASIALLFPANKVSANPSFVTYYSVRYQCVISPPCFDCIEGEWTEWCDGSMTGWGWLPGANCTYTITTYGAECTGGGGHCPECGPDNNG